MIGETRAQVLARIGSDRDVEARPMYRALVKAFFDCVLGPDAGEPLTADDERAVRAAFQEQIDLIVAEAGYTSEAEMEAAQ